MIDLLLVLGNAVQGLCKSFEQRSRYLRMPTPTGETGRTTRSQQLIEGPSRGVPRKNKSTGVKKGDTSKFVPKRFKPEATETVPRPSTSFHDIQRSEQTHRPTTTDSGKSDSVDRSKRAFRLQFCIIISVTRKCEDALIFSCLTAEAPQEPSQNPDLSEQGDPSPPVPEDTSEVVTETAPVNLGDILHRVEGHDQDLEPSDAEHLPEFGENDHEEQLNSGENP
jgi:hypothetical protein